MTSGIRLPVSTPGAKQATGEIKGLDDAFKRIQTQGAKGFGIGVGAAVTTRALGAVEGALASVGDAVGQSIQDASNLTEAQSKVDQVFGESARSLDQWSDDAAESFGQSKRAALEAAGTYGNLLQAFGVARPEALAMSKTLTELASDLASFNNTTVDEAIQALRSGLSGETEPLKRYGIALSDARMRQTLMEQGIKNLGATLTPLQKSQAAYTLILKDSILAQGDFARTSEDLANTQRTTAAELENVRAEMGEKGIPIALEWEKAQLGAARAASGLIIATDAETNSLKQNAEALEDVAGGIPIIGGFIRDYVADLQPAIDAESSFASGARDMANAVDRDSRALDAAAKPTNTLTDETKDLAKAAEDAEREIDDLASTVSEELFGDAINAGNLAQMRQTHDELVKQREAADKGSREYRILTGEIAENQQAMFDLQLQMKEKEGPQAVVNWLIRQKELFGDANGAIQQLIDKYRTLDTVQSRVGLSGNDLGGGSGGRAGGGARRASGGPVQKGRMYTVGEGGPETFVAPDDGQIIPTGGSLPTGTGPGVGLTAIPIPVPMQWTPAMQQQFARDAGPVIVTYLSDRGLI